jgi:hypothetical protein
MTFVSVTFLVTVRKFGIFYDPVKIGSPLHFLFGPFVFLFTFFLVDFISYESVEQQSKCLENTIKLRNCRNIITNEVKLLLVCLDCTKNSVRIKKLRITHEDSEKIVIFRLAQ